MNNSMENGCGIIELSPYTNIMKITIRSIKDDSYNEENIGNQLMKLNNYGNNESNFEGTYKV